MSFAASKNTPYSSSIVKCVTIDWSLLIQSMAVAPNLWSIPKVDFFATKSLAILAFVYVNYIGSFDLFHTEKYKS